MRSRLGAACVLLSCWLAAGLVVHPEAAQRGGRGAQVRVAGRVAAPVDLTGYWVSVVTEDWQWRMFTPPKGDYASVPLNPEGRRVADTWTEAQDGSCKAYGAPAVLRMPGRVRISWVDDETLQLETDAGVQRRLLHFNAAAPAAGSRQRQGHSTAEWMMTTQVVTTTAGSNSRPPQQVQRPPWATLKVVTTNLTAGWLRRNGVPYSENARLTEYFDRFSDGEDEWFTVTALVEDPAYLNVPFIVSSNFRKEPDGSKWKPAPCKDM